MVEQQIQQPNLNILRKWGVPRSLTGNVFIYGRIGCLDENTEILVVDDEGNIVSKALKELSEDESFFVESYDFVKKQTVKQNAFKVKSNVRDGYKITFNDNSYVIVSKKHKFFNLDGDEIESKKLNIGDRLLKLIDIKNDKK